MATKTAVLNFERAELGYKEGPNNHTKYAAMAGHADHQPWCATFQVAMFRHAKMKLGNESAYTPSLYASLPHISGPQVGALAFFYFPSMGRISHVGIVESVRPDGRFVSIEGNTDVAGGRTGGQVMRKVRSTHNVHFAMPHYDAEPTHAPAKPAAKPAAGKLVVDGDFGPATIKALQKSLKVTTSGTFNTATKRALQKKLGVHVDGDFGEESIKALQKHVGAAQDGDWGKITTEDLQKKLNAGTF